MNVHALVARSVRLHADGTVTLDGVGITSIVAASYPVSVSLPLHVHVENGESEPRRLHELSLRVTLAGEPIGAPLRLPFLARRSDQRSGAILLITLALELQHPGEVRVQGDVDGTPFPDIVVAAQSTT